jgi:hypothetical protein
MKLNRELIFNVVITLSILSFYLLMIYSYKSEITLNDLSFIKDDCARNCKGKNVDVMLCLDSCANKEVANNNDHSVFGLVILSIILCALYVKYKEIIFGVLEYALERLNVSKHYRQIDDSDEEMELNHYHKITDI